jgi:hypothetical protein
MLIDILGVFFTNSTGLEASLIIVAWQRWERDSTGSCDLTLYQSLKLRKDKRMWHDPVEMKDW